MHLLKFHFLLIIFSLHCFVASAQDKAPASKYALSLNYHYGFLMQHGDDIGHLANQRPLKLELDFKIQTDGSKGWQVNNNYPVVGYSLNYLHFDPQKPVGDALGLIIYYGKAFYRTPKSELRWRIGLGPGVVFRKFDIMTNNKNNITGSTFNYCLNGAINFSTTLSKRLIFNAGIGLFHLSNGSMKIPNLGMNIPAVYAGLGFISKKKVTFDAPEPERKRRFNSLNLSIGGGFKEIKPIGGSRYFAGVFSAYYDLGINSRTCLNLGYDFIYDYSAKAEIKRGTFDEKLVNGNYMRHGVALGFHYFISQVSFVGQCGYYVFDPLKRYKPFYQRYTVKYNFNEAISAGIALKAHFGQAEIVEWTVGYTLK